MLLFLARLEKVQPFIVLKTGLCTCGFTGLTIYGSYHL
jgi:hypothetical protein